MTTEPLSPRKRRTALESLSKSRVAELTERFELEVRDRRVHAAHVDALIRSRSVTFTDVLSLLTRDELKAMCEALGIDPTGREKQVLIDRLLSSAGSASRPPSAPAPAPLASPSDAPRSTAAKRVVERIAGPPSTRGLLSVLTKPRLAQLARSFLVTLDGKQVKEAQLDALIERANLSFEAVLEWMSRDELREACLAYGLAAESRARAVLAGRLVEARPGGSTLRPVRIFDPARSLAGVPKAGAIVHVRHRQYLVESVVPPPEDGQATLVKMVCLSDDAQGRPLDVLWELELGARVEDEHRLPPPKALDAPRHFGAYLHAIKWNCVTATDARLFQAPFRAGIKLLHHQLTPLSKALSLPRANLFIADDVGLGKTIEAGLVVQELEIRQRIDFVLIVCPASICLQWRDEMERRFGQPFTLFNRAFIGKRRRERGFAVNPWATHNRFIISYQLLRRPEYLEPLLQHLGHTGSRLPKSLLILDEAHTVAPASATRMAIDSRQTKMARALTQRFENRLFLSATPHNGHSNSFSALLELLDPQRFTRGVKVKSTRQLEPVMVRRLKGDLRDMPAGYPFPVRRVVQIALKQDSGAWHATSFSRVAQAGERTDERLADVRLGQARTSELLLSQLLRQYTLLMRPKKGAGQLVFINLQKRLLSSIDAFHHTLELHAKSVAKGTAKTALSFRLADDDEEEHGFDEEMLAQREDAEIEADSATLQSPEGKARELLDQMLKLVDREKTAPDAKVLALVDWLQKNLCPALAIGGASPDTSRSKAWSDRRVLIFTEYADTKRYLSQLLRGAAEGTERGDERVLELHGGMGDERRAAIQRAFNGDPAEHPVRILIATDAAREGINLQNHCADLFHFDVPWNPARMEQRNGRIDRTLQPAKEVRCHYFSYPERAEDAVLVKLATKVETIQRELGSLAGVVMERISALLETRGIDDDVSAELDGVEDDKVVVVRQELERASREQARLIREIEDAGRVLDRSKKIMDFRAEHLRDALDVGLELSGVGKLKSVPGEPALLELPPMSDSWQKTLDSLRPPREKDESLWDWRRNNPPLPVTFEPLERMSEDRAQLHLQHPLVKRVLARFLAQGFSTHDLSRVTVVRSREHAVPVVVAIGRVSLFGAGASRLHDELVVVSAPWSAADGAGEPDKSAQGERQVLHELEELLRKTASTGAVLKGARERMCAFAQRDYERLWPHIRDEADAVAHRAEQQLRVRGTTEADALREILESQRQQIERELGHRGQIPLDLRDGRKDELRQYQDELAYMTERLTHIERELVAEPAQIEALYKVSKQRLSSVGMAYIWPEGMG